MNLLPVIIGLHPYEAHGILKPPAGICYRQKYYNNILSGYCFQVALCQNCQVANEKIHIGSFALITVFSPTSRVKGGHVQP